MHNLRARRDLLQQVNETRDGPWPFATILSCMDSRTSAELIFDQGLGDVFSIRIAGNIVNTDILGSLEFACRVAGSRLLVVLGHSKCSAVRGACDHLEMGHLTELLSKLQPAVHLERETADPSQRSSANPRFVSNVTAINVRRSVRSIVERGHLLAQVLRAGTIGIVGAVHDLDSGVVEFFEDCQCLGPDEVERLAQA